jgi:hypothetical protein
MSDFPVLVARVSAMVRFPSTAAATFSVLSVSVDDKEREEEKACLHANLSHTTQAFVEAL